MDPEEVGHYAAGGPVQALWRWWELAVSDDGSYEAGWWLMDVNLRRCRAQAWLWNNRHDADVARHDIVAVAERFVVDTEAPLWHEFAAIERDQLRQAWAWLGPDPGAGSRPRLVGPDLEVVVLAPTEGDATVITEPTEGVPFVMRVVDGDWFVASFGIAKVPLSGWPPDFDPG